MSGRISGRDTALLDRWQRLARAVEAKKLGRFEPVGEEEAASLRTVFDLPPAVPTLLAAGYPTSAVSILGYQVLPRLAELRRIPEELPWDRTHWPLSSDFHHELLHTRGEQVFSVATEALRRGGGGPAVRLYADLEACIEAMRVMVEQLDESKLVTKKGKAFKFDPDDAWFPDDVLRAVEESYETPGRGPAVFPWFAHLAKSRPQLAEPLG